MTRKTHRVQPNPDGGWDIKKDGGKKTIKHVRLKTDAVDAARSISQNQKSELVIHKKDGTIQNADSHGNDPYPPKG